MNLTVQIPDDIAGRLNASGDLSRRALEALAAEEYKRDRITKPELQRLLGIESSFQLDAFLKAHDVAPGANSMHSLTSQSELLHREFEALAEEWQRDTRHLSQITKKVLHPAYFRITGMGEPVVPLLLEALRDRPAHWFAALRATANIDPVMPGSNPSAAREAWLKWGRSKGLIG